MAKQPVKRYNVAGKSVEQLMQIDPARLSQRELADVVGRLASAGNKRLARLEKQNLVSPASAGVKEKFSIKSGKLLKSQGQLQHEFARAREFLKAKTSSVKGYKEYTRKIEKSTRTDAGKGVDLTKLSKEQQRKMWKLYSRVAEQQPTKDFYTRMRLVNEVMQTPKQGGHKYSYDELENILQEKLNELRNKDIAQYEQEQRADFYNPFEF